MSRKRRKRKSGNHQENIEVVYNTKDDRDTEERLTDSEATDGSENLEETAELNISEETDEAEIERENSYIAVKVITILSCITCQLYVVFEVLYQKNILKQNCFDKVTVSYDLYLFSVFIGKS